MFKSHHPDQFSPIRLRLSLTEFTCFPLHLTGRYYTGTYGKNNRREFLHTVSGLASASAVGMAAGSYSRISGANETINLGLIGAGDRETHVIELFRHNLGVHVTAVCDVFGQKLDAVKQKCRMLRLSATTASYWTVSARCCPDCHAGPLAHPNCHGCASVRQGCLC